MEKLEDTVIAEIIKLNALLAEIIYKTNRLFLILFSKNASHV
jgi:hypothetical protein